MELLVVMEEVLGNNKRRVTPKQIFALHSNALYFLQWKVGCIKCTTNLGLLDCTRTKHALWEFYSKSDWTWSVQKKIIVTTVLALDIMCLNGSKRKFNLKKTIVVPWQCQIIFIEVHCILNVTLPLSTHLFQTELITHMNTMWWETFES